MRLRKRRGGLPVARPQTPHVPSCRLKLGTPRVLVCVLKTHGKSREFTRRANRDHGGGRGRRGGEQEMGDGDGERKNQLTNLPGIKHAPYRVGEARRSPLSSGIRRCSITRFPSDFADRVVLKARTNRT